MRKNRMMRAASALLVAVLLTTSTISGTFAKYVTTASGSDTARVAKWGVVVTGMASDLFDDNYNDTVITSVVNEKLVAPGTANTDGVTFGITGTPEVAVKIKVEVTEADGTGDKAVDVVLPAATYIDYTKTTGLATDGSAVYTDTFTLTEDYHPVKFTLKDKNGDVVNNGTKDLENVTIAEIETYLETAFNEKQYDPKTDLSAVDNFGTYKLTWKWDFGTAAFGAIENVDRADTYLGNVIAGTPADIVKTNVSTDINFAIKVTVEQVD